jgi:hypothetical protein
VSTIPSLPQFTRWPDALPNLPSGDRVDTSIGLRSELGLALDAQVILNQSRQTER